MEIGSESWCTAMSEVLADVELPEVRATVEQRIGDGNGGPVVAYRLVIDGGRAHLEPVPVDAVAAGGKPSEHGDIGERAGEGGGREGDDGGDGEAGDGERLGIGDDGGVVVMSQSRETAEAVRRGEMGALAALQAGLIKVSGDVRVLIAASEALALVNSALGQALDTEGSSASEGTTDDDDRSDRDGTSDVGDSAEEGGDGPDRGGTGGADGPAGGDGG